MSAVSDEKLCEAREWLRQMWLVGIAVERVGGEEMLQVFNSQHDAICAGWDSLAAENARLRAEILRLDANPAA